ncbi:hypothetical protein R3W88_022723 [Solanum pinnatisectum]|uniref:CCHC-type domain-containing protein n=1 Tax=Solanum pinnatisectum TaxID=50273 RepID=A0AAV9LYH1_9SOLN|nr:hypothetical protein R3W88_022723 [Solanum pinnatisectum]
MSSRLRDFTRMNPPMFFGSKVNEDPQKFVEEDNRAIRAGSISWEVFKNAFLGRFFPWEKRIKGGGIYQTSSRRDEMSRFLTGVSDSIEEECRTSILHDNMDISHLMVYGQQIEETRFRKKNREVKRARTDDENFSKGKFEGQSGLRCKKRFSNQGSFSGPRVKKDRVPNPKPQGGNSGASSMVRPTCAKCGKKHDGKCLTTTGVCYGCGKSRHQLKDCPTCTAKGRKGNQDPPSGSNSDAPKKNRFYAL